MVYDELPAKELQIGQTKVVKTRNKNTLRQTAKTFPSQSEPKKQSFAKKTLKAELYVSLPRFIAIALDLECY